MYINVGKKNNLTPSRLIGLINEGLDSGNAEIGKIEILKKFSFFEIEEKTAGKLIAALKGQPFEGVDLTVELSEEKPGSSSFSNKTFSKKRSFSKRDNKGSHKNFRRGDFKRKRREK